MMGSKAQVSPQASSHPPSSVLRCGWCPGLGHRGHVTSQQAASCPSSGPAVARERPPGGSAATPLLGRRVPGFGRGGAGQVKSACGTAGLPGGHLPPSPLSLLSQVPTFLSQHDTGTQVPCLSSLGTMYFLCPTRVAPPAGSQEGVDGSFRPDEAETGLPQELLSRELLVPLFSVLTIH